VFCCKLLKAVGSPSFEKRCGNAVQSPWQRSTLAQNGVTMQWVRNEVAVGTPRWPTAIARRLHSVYAAFMAIARQLHRDYTAFMAIPKRLHYDSNQGDCTAFMAIPKRLHNKPTELSRRLLLPHLDKQINNAHTYTCIYVFVRDRYAFQLSQGVSAEISLTIYLYIVATTFITLGIIIKLSLLTFT
jgi:hypothetical protein